MLYPSTRLTSLNKRVLRSKGFSYAEGLKIFFINSALQKSCVQADPTLYKSIPDGFKTIYRNQGLKGFTVGWHATLLGYSAQGFGKFGFYEMFKDVYKWAVGPNKAAQYQTVGFLVSSACAEVIADTFLAPFEAVSIFSY